MRQISHDIYILGLCEIVASIVEHYKNPYSSVLIKDHVV